MAIFGTSHLSDAGDLLIFNKLSHKTLLMFEKELGRDRITYLVEEALPPDAAIAAIWNPPRRTAFCFARKPATPSPCARRSWSASTRGAGWFSCPALWRISRVPSAKFPRGS